MGLFFVFLDTRPPAKPRRKRKSTATNNANTPGNNNPNPIPTNKDANINHCTIPTPTKKRSPANTVYSQPAMTPNTNSMPGVRIIYIYRISFKFQWNSIGCNDCW